MGKKQITVRDIIMARLNCDSVLLQESEWNARQKAERSLLRDARHYLIFGPEDGVPVPDYEATRQLIERCNHV